MQGTRLELPQNRKLIALFTAPQLHFIVKCSVQVSRQNHNNALVAMKQKPYPNSFTFAVKRLTTFSHYSYRFTKNDTRLPVAKTQSTSWSFWLNELHRYALFRCQPALDLTSAVASSSNHTYLPILRVLVSSVAATPPPNNMVAPPRSPSETEHCQPTSSQTDRVRKQ